MSTSKSRKQIYEESPLIHCGCGYCDELIHSITKRGNPAKFKHGHNAYFIKQKPRLGSDSSNFRGGRVKINKYYYILARDHPFRTKLNYYLEHRAVLEQYLSEKYKMAIYLLPYFEVHHKDGIKDNNIPENLEMLTKFRHRQITFSKDKSGYRCDECGSDQTYRYDKTGYYMWRVHPITKGWCCIPCFNRKFRNYKTK